MESDEAKKATLSDLLAEMSRMQSPIESQHPLMTSDSLASPLPNRSQSEALSFRAYDEVDRLAAECDRLRADLERY